MLRIILLTSCLILQNHLAVAQYETGGKESFIEFTDLDSGPVPKWSPTGEGFALMTSRGIIVRKNDSTSLIEPAQNDFQWSHDGKSIIYTSKGYSGVLKVFRYDLKDKLKTLLSLEDKWSDFYPTISPNDSIVTYYSAKNEPFKIFNLKDGQTSKLIGDATSEYLHPKWSPRGKYLIYYKNKQSNSLVIEVIDFSSKKVVLTINGNEYDFHNWSPDESKILVREIHGSAENSNYFSGRLIILDVETGSKTILTKKFKNILYAEWSPKMNQIAFSANQNIFVINSNGSELKQIVKRGWFPRYHPTREKLIIVKGKGVCEVDPTGENLKLLYEIQPGKVER